MLPAGTSGISAVSCLTVSARSPRNALTIRSRTGCNSRSALAMSPKSSRQWSKTANIHNYGTSRRVVMAELKIDGDELVLHLTTAEKVEGAHGDLRTPRSAVRAVEVIEDAHREAGLRAGL